MPEKRRLSPLRAPSRRPPCRSLAVILSKKHGGISVFHSKRIEHNPKNVLFQVYKQMNLQSFEALKLPMRDSFRVCNSVCIPSCAPFSVFKLSFSLHIRSVCADVHNYSRKPSRRGSFFRLSFVFSVQLCALEKQKKKTGANTRFDADSVLFSAFCCRFDSVHRFTVRPPFSNSPPTHVSVLNPNSSAAPRAAFQAPPSTTAFPNKVHQEKHPPARYHSR